MKFLYQLGLFLLLFIFAFSSCHKDGSIISSNDDISHQILEKLNSLEELIGETQNGVGESSNEDEPKGGEVSVPAPDDLKSFAGKNRLKLAWKVDADSVSKTMIFWDSDNGTKAVEVAIEPEEGEVTVSQILNLPERAYDLRLYNYNQSGSVSKVAKVTGKSYGEDYRNSLVKKRQIDKVEINNDKAEITWGTEVDEAISGVVLSYVDDNGGEKNDTIDVSENETTINDLKLGTPIGFKTIYLPESNAMDTFMTSLATAPYILKMDKSKFSGHLLPGDNGDKTLDDDITQLWDGKWSDNMESPFVQGDFRYEGVTTSASMWGAKPVSLTIDLGSLVQLDSFLIHLYRQFHGQCLRKYEIWGAAAVDGTGDWDNWTKLVYKENIKPSGKPDKQLTSEDKEAWKKGSANKISWDRPKVRYVRIKCLQNYYVFYGEGTSSNDRNNYNFDLAEITFWQVVK